MKANWYRKVMYKSHPINITEWKLIDEELKELERLAEIGRATEMFIHEHECVYGLNTWYDEGEELVRKVKEIDSIDELLEWAKEQSI